MLVDDLPKPYPSHRLYDGRREMSALQQLTDVGMLSPRWVVVPVVILDAFERKEDGGAPDAVPER